MVVFSIKLSNFYFSILLLNFIANENSEPDAKRQKKPSKILDGTFFTLQKRDGDLVEATCSHCKEIKKGNVNSTGNFISHYKSKHTDHVNELKSYLKKSTSERPVKAKPDGQPPISESFQNTSGDTVRNKFLFYELLFNITLAYQRILFYLLLDSIKAGRLHRRW